MISVQGAHGVIPCRDPTEDLQETSQELASAKTEKNSLEATNLELAAQLAGATAQAEHAKMF